MFVLVARFKIGQLHLDVVFVVIDLFEVDQVVGCIRQSELVAILIEDILVQIDLSQAIDGLVQ